MPSISKYLIIFSFLLSNFYVFSQNEGQQSDLIQFSGLVLNTDSIIPVPFVNIYIKNTRRGTVSDYYGYFSLVTKKHDTIIFSSVGYKKETFIIPDTISENKFFLLQILEIDTIRLKEVIIYSWLNYEQFKEVFVKFDVPDDDFERAKKNLELLALMSQFENMTMVSSSINYKYYMDRQSYIMAHKGMYPQSLTSAINNPLLNPFAWVKFFEAWKRGDFKRKK